MLETRFIIVTAVNVLWLRNTCTAITLRSPQSLSAVSPPSVRPSDLRARCFTMSRKIVVKSAGATKRPTAVRAAEAGLLADSEAREAEIITKDV